uniref:Large ribosomal subunit protein bL12 n=1 Tax=candidate division CPR3 bacterium TaxID=2268181 RepID=A0A7C4M1I1_UNCC3
MADETTQPTEEVKEDVTANEPKEEKKEKKSTGKGIEKLVEEIKGLKLTEVAELVSALEDEFGVSAAMPMMAMAGAPAAGGDAGAPAEEKSAFNVELTASGDNKIGVIKAVREVIPELGLKEAKDLVDGAPKVIKENVKKEDAENIKKKIEEAGGKVTLK